MEYIFSMLIALQKAKWKLNRLLHIAWTTIMPMLCMSTPRGTRADCRTPIRAMVLIILRDSGLCGAEAGDWGSPNAESRPFVAATSRHGLVDGEIQPLRHQADDLISSATSESSHKVPFDFQRAKSTLSSLRRFWYRWATL